MSPEDHFAHWHELAVTVAEAVSASSCRVVGVSGCQGSGKSTFSSILAERISASGADGNHAARAVSIDDFYLRQKERRRLAETVHPLLATRGVPGTHDWQWLRRVLSALHENRREVLVPRFDKGMDDRVGEESVAADVLILEGWCVGVHHQPPSLLAEPSNGLEQREDADRLWRTWVNEQVRDNYEPIWSMVDLWVHLRAPDFAVVRTWRSQQEQDLPESQRMTGEELERFIAHYERLTRWQLGGDPDGPGYAVALDSARNVLEVTLLE